MSYPRRAKEFELLLKQSESEKEKKKEKMKREKKKISRNSGIREDIQLTFE